MKGIKGLPEVEANRMAGEIHRMGKSAQALRKGAPFRVPEPAAMRRVIPRAKPPTLRPLTTQVQRVVETNLRRKLTPAEIKSVSDGIRRYGRLWNIPELTEVPAEVRIVAQKPSIYYPSPQTPDYLVKHTETINRLTKQVADLVQKGQTVESASRIASSIEAVAPTIPAVAEVARPEVPTEPPTEPAIVPELPKAIPKEKILYHGTNIKTPTELKGEVIFLSKSKEVAKFHGKNIIEVDASKLNILDPKTDTSQLAKEINQYLAPPKDLDPAEMGSFEAKIENNFSRLFREKILKAGFDGVDTVREIQVYKPIPVKPPKIAEPPITPTEEEKAVVEEPRKVVRVFELGEAKPAEIKRKVRELIKMPPGKKVVRREDILLRERLRAEIRGARFGELEGRRQKQLIINDIRAEQVDIQKIKAAAIIYLNQNLELKDRGKFLTAVKDAKKSEDLITIMNRAEVVGAQTGRHIAIAVLKRETKRTRRILATGRRKKGKPRISVEAQDRLRVIVDNLTQFKPGGEKQRAAEMAATFYATHPDQAMPPELKKKVYDLSKSNISEMSTDEIRQLTKDIRDIRATGRTALEAKEEVRLRIVERNRAELIASINKHSIKKPEVVTPGKVLTPSERKKSKLALMGESLNRATAALKIPSFITDALDGYQMFPVLGKAHRLITAQINKASDLREAGIDRVNKKVVQILTPLGKKASWYLSQTKTIGGRRLTIENMWAIYANSKNPSNRATLTEEWGYNFSEALVNEVVAEVSPRDKRIVDRIMKEIVEALYPETVRITQQYSGFTPQTVKNYWMIMGDKELSDRILMREKEKDLLTDVWKKTSMDLGSVKQRVGHSGAPDLNFFRVLKRHTNEVIHFNTHALAVRNVQEIINDPAVKASIINTATGKGGYNALKSSLSNIANPQKTPANWFESKAKVLRRNSTAVALGIKVSVSLLQGGSIFQTIYRTGLPSTIGAIKAYWKNPKAADRFIYEHSTAQKYRRRSFDRELKELIDGMNWMNKLPGAKNLVFSMIQGIDHITTMPSWLSAYRQATKRRLSLENTIAHADDIVEKTQPTGRLKALAQIMRGSEFQHWFTMFYTFFSNAYNNMALAGGKFRYRLAKGNIVERTLSFAEFSRAYLWLLIFPAIYASMVRKPRKFFTREWGKEKQKYVAKAIISYALGTFPFIRDIGNVIINPQFDFMGSPVFGVGKEVKTLAQARAKTEEGLQKQKERKLKAGTMLGGYLTGWPSGQTVITVGGAIDLWERNTTNWLRLFLSEWTLEGEEPEKPSAPTPYKATRGKSKKYTPKVSK